MCKFKQSSHNSQRSTQCRAPSREDQKQEFLEYFRNHSNIHDYLLALLHDGYNRFTFTRSADSLRRDTATICRRITSEGIGFAAIVLPSLFQAVLNYLENGISSYPGWKLQKGCDYPAFLQQFFAKIYDSKFCENDRVMYIEWLYQFCVAFKKLKGPYRNCVLRKQLADFVQTDIDLRYLRLTSDADVSVIGKNARQLITNVIKNLDVDFQYAKFVPRPGPGATNTPIKKHLRFRPHVLYTQLNDEFPYEEWFYSHPWDLVTETKWHPFKLPLVEMPTSRFKFVPKTYGKPRGICIEQLETQYLQQALKKGLYDVIERHPLTRGKVNFASQKINGDLALSSSRSRELATIDMKEASDRISRKLVSYLFGGNDDFRMKLLSLSTTIIELPDDIKFIREFPTAKFAPMGSALCFPVMALVHYALIRAIADKVGLQQHLDSIYVYGDDIICHRDLVEAVYFYLPKFGMKLNENKSYFKSYFRESCGVHAYHGTEITPVYFKDTPNINMNVQQFVGLLHTERQLHKRGYAQTARLLRSELRRINVWFNELPYVGPKSPMPGFIRDKVILSHNNIKYYKRRWDSATQCFEYRVKVIGSVQEQLPPIKQNEGLLRWHTTQAPLERKLKLGCVDEWVQGHVKGSLLRLAVATVWLRESLFNAVKPMELIGHGNVLTCKANLGKPKKEPSVLDTNLNMLSSLLAA